MESTPSGMPALWQMLENDYMRSMPYGDYRANLRHAAHKVNFRAIQWASFYLQKEFGCDYCLNPSVYWGGVQD